MGADNDLLLEAARAVCRHPFRKPRAPVEELRRVVALIDGRETRPPEERPGGTGPAGAGSDEERAERRSRACYGDVGVAASRRPSLLQERATLPPATVVVRAASSAGAACASCDDLGPLGPCSACGRPGRGP